jgi:hypothetical protein
VAAAGSTNFNGTNAPSVVGGTISTISKPSLAMSSTGGSATIKASPASTPRNSEASIMGGVNVVLSGLSALVVVGTFWEFNLKVEGKLSRYFTSGPDKAATKIESKKSLPPFLKPI